MSSEQEIQIVDKKLEQMVDDCQFNGGDAKRTEHSLSICGLGFPVPCKYADKTVKYVKAHAEEMHRYALCHRPTLSYAGK